VHRSSETIGKIAAALAQAQKQLQNPERTLTATIVSPFARETETIAFRYASLATGLEIVRKALGEQEIATIQTTSFDKEDSLIRLSTVLAHSSGEWIGSDWPVCPIGHVVAPHRLGAALTYARRYALFTLAGIAGEDDLDAPDLLLAPAPDDKAVFNSGQERASGTSLATRKATMLSKEQSAVLRSQLLTELEKLQTVDELTLWALRRLPRKNRLTDPDAGVVEVAYEGRLATAQAEAAKEADQFRDAREAIIGDPTQREHELSHQSNQHSAQLDPGFEAAVIQLPKMLRQRDKAHLAFVASQPCLVCQRAPSDAHHLRFAQPRALGRKSSDEFTVPLCRAHHRELHRAGNERSWGANIGIAPLDVANQLWRISRTSNDHSTSSGIVGKCST
jgi:hypothetical protein